MNIFQVKTILFVVGSLLWYMTIAVVLYTVFGPVVVESTAVPPQRRVAAGTEIKGQELPGIAAFATVWDTPLQRPVFDTPPPPPPPETRPVMPQLKAKLVATMIDQGQPATMFKLPSGRYATLRLGETFENEPGTARIVEINGKQVSIQFDGFDETLIISVGK
ncbi:MAG: hypothetical protein Q4G68_13685 [Planctomycetia bacterium]|nr:hypothetical protein [Planctomycetia bacterium]